MTPPADALNPPPRPTELDAIVDALAGLLAATAVARDAAGGHAAAERQVIRDSGLLALSVPLAHGGWGADWPTVFGVLRRLARVGSALAHLFGFHHLQVASLLIYGSAAQQARQLRATIDQRLFWGNALNPLDRRLLATETPDGWQLDGVKNYASGSVGSDRLMLTAWHAPSASLLIATLPTASPGITVQADWDAFGQRQTDSGTVRFDQVALPGADVLLAPGASVSVRATLRAQVAQLVLVNLYLGIAEGALAQARLRLGTACQADGVSRSTDDPIVQHRFGQLHLLVRPAQLLADAAAARVQQAWDRGDALSDAERGSAAIAVAEAKVLAHRAALEVSSQFFELTGASSTSGRLGLDRFWRNARVHTLHDPVDHKLRDLGRFALTGAWPTPTPYA